MLWVPKRAVKLESVVDVSPPQELQNELLEMKRALHNQKLTALVSVLTD